MKKLCVFILIGTVSMSLCAWENHDWLAEYSWYLEMNDKGPYIYWHSYKTPYGEFDKLSMPAESTVYRNRLRNERFKYFYQTDTEKEKVFSLVVNKDHESKDIEYDVSQRENYSYMSITQGLIPLAWGDRNGGQHDEDHPLVGIWGTLPFLSEIRLVEPADYVLYLEIEEKIPGFAIRYGNYLFKQTGDKVFETDSCFPDGHMRLEIKNNELLVLTPLFKLPDEKGLVEPLFMRRIPKRQDSQ